MNSYFLNLIDNDTPPHHKFHKLINKINVKVSYNCMPNMQPVINAHNKKILTLRRNQEKDFGIVLIKPDARSMRSVSQIIYFIRQSYYHQQKRLTEANLLENS